MSGSCRWITTDQEQTWEEILRRFPVECHDIHLTARYHRLYEANGDGQAVMFVYEEDRDTYAVTFLLRPVPPFPGFESSFDIESAYGYAGPVSTTESPAFLAAADSAFCAVLKEKQVITEFVRFHPLLDNVRFVPPSSGMQVLRLRDYVTVDLQRPEQERWESYSPQNRNKIRKAEKAGYRIERGNPSTDFEVFVDIYLENMRQLRAASAYFFSPPYFTELQELTISDGILLLAQGSAGTVGAGVFFHSGPWAHYFLASVTPEGRQHGVGNLLLHEGIRWAAGTGARTMHLGGGLSADPQDALFVFKRNFSSLTVPFHIGKRIHRPEDYQRLIACWEEKYPQGKGAFTAILQRYRWEEKDFPVNH